MKCEMCGQILQYKQNIKSPSNSRWVCINSECPDYFEPAATHPQNPKLGKALEGGFRPHDSCGTIQVFDDKARVYYCPKCDPREGVKLDTDKPLVYTEFLRQFPRAIRMIARVGEAGSKAPGHVRSGWKTVERGHERYSDAFGRHILKEALLATVEDPSSEDPLRDIIWEAATVAWNDLARLEHLIRENNAAAERLDGDPLA